LLRYLDENTASWTDDALARLNGDLADDTLAAAFTKTPELAKSWQKLSGFPTAIRRNLDNLNQRRLLDQYAPGIANASNARKGNFGEIAADLDLNTKGYESLITRIDNIDSSGHGGLDGVFRKDGEYFIIEGKYTGSASLNPANPATGLPRQMSDDWIKTRSWDGVGLSKNSIKELLETKNYTRVLAKAAPDGSVTYQLVKADGYVVKGGAGVFIP
jgi:hypothetical protein